MVKQIGIIICNFNKEAYVVNCVKSIFQSTMQNFDIIVVDNASTDNSVAKLRENFGNRIKIVENKENVGGSGGFNSGFKEALKGEYEYLMLVDNDVVLEPTAIEELFECLKNNQDIALVGAQIYQMDLPDVIMALGSMVDFQKCKYIDCYNGKTDSDEIPEINYCDYVPACTLMVKRSVVDNVGIFPEDNFIYWDDIDWCTRIRIAGYKIAAITKAKVWHKGGGKAPTNTFPTYYYYRNAVRYFAKYVDEIDFDNFVDRFLEDIFLRLYGSFKKGKNNYMTSIVKAYEDAFDMKFGKAEDGTILPLIDEKNDFLEFVNSNDDIVWILQKNGFDDNPSALQRFIYYTEKIWEGKSIWISCDECNEYTDTVKQLLSSKGLKNYYKLCNMDDHSVKIHLCNHVKNIKKYDSNLVWVDGYANIVRCEEDYLYFRNYENSLDLFKACNKEHFIRNMMKLRIVE